MSLEGITNTLQNMNMPTVSTLFYAGAGLFAGRKFCISGCFKIGGKIAEMIGSKHAAFEWNKAGDEYLTLAKKDAIRDLTAVAGFIAAVSLLNGIEDSIKAKEEKLEQASKEWKIRFKSLLLGISSTTVIGSATILLINPLTNIYNRHWLRHGIPGFQIDRVIFF